jgi:hypothetical protein
MYELFIGMAVGAAGGALMRGRKCREVGTQADEVWGVTALTPPIDVPTKRKIFNTFQHL